MCEELHERGCGYFCATFACTFQKKISVTHALRSHVKDGSRLNRSDWSVVDALLARLVSLYNTEV